MVSMGDFSKEFCGGTHVKNTSEIAAFKIISENGVAAGVRRIEALTGDNVFAYYRNLEKELLEAAKAAKATPVTLTEKIEHMQAEIKEPLISKEINPQYPALYKVYEYDLMTEQGQDYIVERGL